MVHTRDSIHRLRHVVDLFEYFFGEDVTLIDSQHDVDVIGATELVSKLEVHLHERMPIGQEIIEGRSSFACRASYRP